MQTKYSRAILHDANIYPEPEKFNPDRFMTDDGHLDPNVPDPAGIAAFGFGRRVCPGRDFIMQSIWLSVAWMLATFEIGKAKDAEGRVIEPDVEYTSGFIRCEGPLKSKFMFT